MCELEWDTCLLLNVVFWLYILRAMTTFSIAFSLLPSFSEVDKHIKTYKSQCGLEDMHICKKGKGSTEM